MNCVQHLSAETYHGRRGPVKNAFRYSLDYVLLDADKESSAPFLFGRDRGNLVSLHTVDHGGEPKKGTGSAWVRDVLVAHEMPLSGKILILAQPRVLGHVFNPVSFWLCYDADDILRVVIAEVTNTFGDRHSYLCAHEDMRAITKHDTIAATKLMHVSPFQPIEGGYTFRFDITPENVLIHIDYSRGNGGLIATLAGARKPMTNRSLIWAVLRRPFGSRRVLGLIHWQALKLWFKGATFRSQPAPPADEVSR